MEFQKLVKIAPGVILALVFCLFSQGINNVIGIELFGTSKSPVSTVMIAILLGIIMGNAFTPRPGMMVGLDFTQQYILKLGIIFLGIRLSFVEFIKFGSIAIPLIIVCILTSFFGSLYSGSPFIPQEIKKQQNNATNIIFLII